MSAVSIKGEARPTDIPAEPSVRRSSDAGACKMRAASVDCGEDHPP